MQSLTSAGVRLVRAEPASAQDPVLVLFSTLDPALLAQVRRLAATGSPRLIAATRARAADCQSGIWKLLHAGACDVLHYADSQMLAQQVSARLQRWEEIDELLIGPLVEKNCIGRSSRWRGVLRQVIEAATFSDTSILLTGESGTGKELMARLIHTLDRRLDKRDLIVLDCTTIVDGLSGSEFFGHERGAFTGAAVERDGAFALADGGTLFLDEIGELPLHLQGELLRVIQERTYKRVGGNQWRTSKFRLVCATNRDLFEEQAAGRFRRDLFYRVAGRTCHLPPLRERTSDIVELAQFFLKDLRPDEATIEFDDLVSDYLMQRSYPGNVRELKHLVARLLSRHVGAGPITVGAIPEEELPQPAHPTWNASGMRETLAQALMVGVSLKEIGKQAENLAVQMALELEHDNLQRAARRLGVTDRALQIRRASQRDAAAGSLSGLDPNAPAAP